MINQVKFSIIIPHYNLVNLLVRCLASIPEREDLEVIVVDDLSNVDNLKLLGRIKLKSNVKVIETDRKGGAGHARNIGLANSHGKWLLFADADDYFARGFDKIIDYYYSSNYDVVFFDFETRVSETNQLKSSRVIGSDRAVKRKDVDFFRFRFHGPWAKLIRRSLVVNNNITFDEVICSNDTFFSGKIGKYAKNCIIDDHKIYVTTIRQGSLVHNMSEESLLTRLEVSKRYNQFLKKNGKNKYRINLLSLIFYFKSIDKRKFQALLKDYWKEESLKDIFVDGNKCITGFVKQKIFRSKDLRKQINVHK